MLLFVVGKLVKAIGIVQKVHSLLYHTRVTRAASQVHPLSHLLLQLVVLSFIDPELRSMSSLLILQLPCTTDSILHMVTSNAFDI